MIQALSLLTAIYALILAEEHRAWERQRVKDDTV